MIDRIQQQVRARGGRGLRAVGGLSLVVVGLAVFAAGCSSAPVDPKLIEPRIVAEFPGYSEGIVFDASGTAFASVVGKETVFVMRGDGPPQAWYRTTEPNGHKILPDGTHVLAARGGVHHLDASGKLIEVFAPELATPNDLALDGDGGIYVTVPAKSSDDRNAMRSGVYYIDAARVVRRVADGFCYPNGVAVRADGKSLVVNDSCNRKVYEFTITSPGVLAERRLFAELPNPKSTPDGMTFDRAGRLYLADYGAGMVVVFDDSGKIVREYPTGLQHASNVAFGGEDLTDLYVTGSQAAQSGGGRLVVLPVGTPGRELLSLPASIRDR